MRCGYKKRGGKGFRRAALFCGLLVSLAGCIGFQARPLSPQETAAAFTARTLRDPALHTYLERRLGRPQEPWPPPSWDFPLLMLAASYYHSDLAVARAQWDTAQAGALAAGARPNPTAKTGAQRNLDAASVSPWTLGLDLSFTLETAGKRGDRLAQAQHQAEAARLRLAATTWQVASRLRRRLLALYHARQSAGILQRIEGAQARAVALLEQRQAAGDRSSFELTQTRIALDDTRLRRRAVDTQAAVALARAGDALGLPAAALADAKLSLSLFDHPALAADALDPEMRTQALQRRPDVLAALAEYAAAESALKLEVARQYPDLQLGPGYAWDQGARKWSLALGFVLPLLNRNEGPIAVARARREEAAARFVAIQDQASGEFDAARAEYAAALKQMETADGLVAANEASVRVLRQRLRPGPLSSLAELNGEIALVGAELARLDALVQAQQAFGRLEDAVYRPLDPLELPAAAEVGAQGAAP